jgi:hypothetical protein
MTNGLDSLLDERTAKTLDRLQRYSNSNQRSYFAALRELRTVQNNRLLRVELALEDEDNPLPELVSVAQLTKQSQLDTGSDCPDWPTMKAIIDAPLPRPLRNEATPDLNRFRQEVA